MKEEKSLTLSEIESSKERLRISAGCSGMPSISSMEKLEEYVVSQLNIFLVRMDSCDTENKLGDYIRLRTSLHSAALDKSISHEDFEEKISEVLTASELYSCSQIVESLSTVSDIIAKRLEISNALRHLAKSTLLLCDEYGSEIGKKSIAWTGGYSHSEKMLSLEQNRHIDPDDIKIANSHIMGTYSQPKEFHAYTFSREIVLKELAELTKEKIRTFTNADIKKKTDDLYNSAEMRYMFSNYEGSVITREEATKLFSEL